MANKSTHGRKSAASKPSPSLKKLLERIADLRRFGDEIKTAPIPDPDTRMYALGVWTGFPVFWAGAPESLRDESLAVHKVATDYLIKLAHHEGIKDGAALEHAGRLCRRLFSHHQDVWNLDAESRSCPNWPECLGGRLYDLKPGEQDAIEAGERIITELRLELPDNGQEVETPQAKEPPAPKKYLWNWGEILDAVNEKNNEETRRRVARVNKLRNGPILISGKGSQPQADRAELIEWWNQLTVEYQDTANQRTGKRLEAEAQHHYGKTGTVAPEIGGSAKPRRKDRKG